MLIITSHGIRAFSADEMFARLEELQMVARHGVDYYKRGDAGNLDKAEKFAELLAGDPLAEKALAVIREVNEIHGNRKAYKTSAKGMRDHISTNYKGISATLTARDGYKCAHCGATAKLEIDHIKPLARGGTNDDSNLQWLCRTCNGKKGAR